MEWQRYIYVTCKQEYNFFEIHIVREIQELFYHTVSRHHTLSLRHSYDCRFMVKIIPVIRYTISTV